MAPAYSGAERRGILIRNIVFDMGKVLVDYSGMPVCRHFTDNEALAKRICMAVFDSPEWVLLDMGVIKEKDGIEKMISRLDTEEEKELAVKCFDHWHEYNLSLIHISSLIAG